MNYKVFALVEIFGTDLMVHRRYSKRSSRPKEKFTPILWYQNLVSFFYKNWAWKNTYQTILTVRHLTVIRVNFQMRASLCSTSQYKHASIARYMVSNALFPQGEHSKTWICIKNAVKTMMLVNFSEWWNDQIFPSGHHRQQCFFNETRNYLIQISVDCRPKHIFFSHSKQNSYTC